MTYKEIIDSIKTTVDRHLILKDFGYGALTDIKTVDEGTRVNYPYAFLNPTQSTRTGQSIIYRFNLIVMDIAQEDPTNGFANYLKVQSDCQQYIDDILANLRFAEPYKKFDLTLNVNLTPFKERFADTLAGMTATLEIELPMALNDCVTPFLSTAIVNYGWFNQETEPDPNGQSIGPSVPVYDPQSLFLSSGAGPWPYTGVYFKTAGTYEIQVFGAARATENNKPIPGTPEHQLYYINMVTGNINSSTSATEMGDSDNWPTTYNGATFNEWSGEWTITVDPALMTTDVRCMVTYGLRGDLPGVDESPIEFVNTKVNIYEL